MTDRIEKKVVLRASRARVWRALSDSREFGAWFGMRIDAPFAPGVVVKGAIAPTVADPEVAKLQKPYEGHPVELMIERVEPERLLSFRWHPFAIEKGVDYSSEPTTLVEFTLDDAEGGVLLTVTESGFDKLPSERRSKAFAANEGGWAHQLVLIGKYLEQKS
jgi:uncharacterized protein YndB with AHSA1/START domain